MKKLKTKSEMYSNFEIYAIVLNNENVPGPIISLIKKNQLKSTSRWSKYCHVPIIIDMHVSFEIYAFNEKYIGQVIYMGKKDECLRKYSEYMQQYSKWREEGKI